MGRITSLRLSKTQRHRNILFYKMYHLSYLLLLAGLGLAAAAPRKHGQERHHQHEVQCRTEYTTLWDTEYQDIETHECVTKWVPVCETYTETECSTENREECEYTWEGEGENVEWVAIPGTCELQPHDECVDVTKQKCTEEAKEMCEDEHKRIPVRVSKRVPKKACDDVYADSHDNSEYEHTKDYDEDSSDGKKDRKKNKKHKKDSDEDEDSSDEKKDRKKNKKHKKNSDEDEDY